MLLHTLGEKGASLWSVVLLSDERDLPGYGPPLAKSSLDDDAVSALVGYDGEPHFAFLYLENGIRFIPLCKYRLLFENGQDLPAIADGC